MFGNLGYRSAVAADGEPCGAKETGNISRVGTTDSVDQLFRDLNCSRRGGSSSEENTGGKSYDIAEKSPQGQSTNLTYGHSDLFQLMQRTSSEKSPTSATTTTLHPEIGGAPDSGRSHVAAWRHAVDSAVTSGEGDAANSATVTAAAADNSNEHSGLPSKSNSTTSSNGSTFSATFNLSFGGADRGGGKVSPEGADAPQVIPTRASSIMKSVGAIIGSVARGESSTQPRPHNGNNSSFFGMSSLVAPLNAAARSTLPQVQQQPTPTPVQVQVQQQQPQQQPLKSQDDEQLRFHFDTAVDTLEAGSSASRNRRAQQAHAAAQAQALDSLGRRMGGGGGRGDNYPQLQQLRSQGGAVAPTSRPATSGGHELGRDYSGATADSPHARGGSQHSTGSGHSTHSLSASSSFNNASGSVHSNVGSSHSHSHVSSINSTNQGSAPYQSYLSGSNSNNSSMYSNMGSPRSNPGGSTHSFISGVTSHSNSNSNPNSTHSASSNAAMLALYQEKEAALKREKEQSQQLLSLQQFHEQLQQQHEELLRQQQGGSPSLSSAGGGSPYIGSQHPVLLSNNLEDGFSSAAVQQQYQQYQFQQQTQAQAPAQATSSPYIGSQGSGLQQFQRQAQQQFLPPSDGCYSSASPSLPQEQFVQNSGGSGQRVSNGGGVGSGHRSAGAAVGPGGSFTNAVPLKVVTSSAAPQYQPQLFQFQQAQQQRQQQQKPSRPQQQSHSHQQNFSNAQQQPRYAHVNPPQAQVMHHLQLQQTQQQQQHSRVSSSQSRTQSMSHGFSGSSQNQSFVAPPGPGEFVYQVHFKLSHMYCTFPSGAAAVAASLAQARNAGIQMTPIPALNLNDFVIVDADRGEALGIVVALIPAEMYKALHITWGVKGLSYIKRLATPHEIMLLPIKAEDELKALQTCFEKACLFYKLPIVLVDAEFQFDRQKLTFVFKSKGRVDFRELVRDLFAIYETRIWMSQMEVLPVINVSAKRAITSGTKPTKDISKDWTSETGERV